MFGAVSILNHKRGIDRVVLVSKGLPFMDIALLILLEVLKVKFTEQFFGKCFENWIVQNKQLLFTSLAHELIKCLNY